MWWLVLGIKVGGGCSGKRMGYKVKHPSSKSCRNVLYLLIVVGVTLALGRRGLK